MKGQGSRPRLYVTGARHSGTTVTIRLARECGWELGHPLRSHDDLQGLEWLPFHTLVTRMAGELAGGFEPHPGWAELDLSVIDDVIGRYRQQVEALDFPEAVKLPEYGQHLLLDTIAPETIVVTTRRREGWLESMKKNRFAASMDPSDLWNGYLAKIGQIVTSATRLGIPTTIVDFDLLVSNQEQAVAALASPFDVPEETVAAAWRRIVRPR